MSIDKRLCVWVWNGKRWLAIDCTPVSVTQAMAMLLISDKPLMFLAEGEYPPDGDD